MQNEKCYFSILYTLYKCTSYIFASQPASFNQVHQTLVQLARKRRAVRLQWENMTSNQTFGYTPTPHTHRPANLGTDTHIQYADTLVGTQERTYI